MVTGKDFLERINVIFYHLHIEPRAQTNPSPCAGALLWLWKPEKFPFLSCCPLCALDGTLFPLIRVANWLQPLSLTSEGPSCCRCWCRIGQRRKNSLEGALIGMEGGGGGRESQLGKVFNSYVSESPNSSPNGNPPFWGIHTAPGKQLMSSLPASFLSRALRDSTVPFHKICRW